MIPRCLSIGPSPANLGKWLKRCEASDRAWREYVQHLFPDPSRRTQPETFQAIESQEMGARHWVSSFGPSEGLCSNICPLNEASAAEGCSGTHAKPTTWCWWGWSRTLVVRFRSLDHPNHDPRRVLTIAHIAHMGVWFSLLGRNERHCGAVGQNARSLRLSRAGGHPTKAKGQMRTRHVRGPRGSKRRAVRPTLAVPAGSRQATTLDSRKQDPQCVHVSQKAAFLGHPPVQAVEP